MNSQVYVDVSAVIIERIYPQSHNIPYVDAQRGLRSIEGILVFMSEQVRVMYGISYTRTDDTYVVSVNVGGAKFEDMFDDLSDIFKAYGLDYNAFRYVHVHDLKKVAIEAQQEQQSGSRTNDA
jgi:hypothetical protein